MNWLVLFLTQKKKMYKEQFISSIPDVTAANRFMIVTDTTTISIWIGRNFKIYFLMFNHNAKLGK